MNDLAKPDNCTCRYPDLIARNMSGHGNDPQGNPCPVHVAFMAALKKQESAEREIPRRCYKQKWTPAERAIHDAVQAVEEAGAHPLLTEAVVLLQQAFNKVADHTDLEENP